MVRPDIQSEIRLHPPRIVLLREQLVRVGKAFEFSQGVPNLAEYADTILIPRLRKELGKPHPQPAYILFAGPPSSGKTRFMEIMQQYVITSLELSPDDERITTVNWETHGEQIARSRGKVLTPSHKPFTKEELHDSSRAFQESLIHTLESGKLLVFGEIPIGGLERNGIYLGKSYAYPEMRDFFTQQGDFAELAKLYPYTPYLIKMAGGPYVHYLLTYFRDEFNTATSLEQAQQVAAIYGQPIPQTEHEWKARKSGASVEQIDDVERELADAIFQHRLAARVNEGESRKLMAHAEFFQKHRGIIEEMTNVLGLDINFVMPRLYYIVEAQPKIIELFGSKIYPTNLRKLSFTGFNNPGLEELGIDRDTLLAHRRSKRS